MDTTFHLIFQLYTLYVNLPNQKTLAAHWREQGEHFNEAEGRDFDLATEIHDIEFPSWDFLKRFGWDGHLIL